VIPDSFKQELLHRVDVVDVIERFVPLKKGGTNFLACCPFHSEKTPSFTVSPTKQFYHCFGCGAHGNAISFLMEYQGLGYIEALKDLAESVGMKLPEFEPRAAKTAAGPDLYDIMQRACDYYREQLKSAPRAIEYLKGRGLTGKVSARFGIGYAPDGWQNLESVFPNYADKALKDAGLVIDGEGGRRYDRFRDRIMFPILNQRGSVIAFGGRVLGEGEPKYLNSPETPLFEKGRELYGLSQARAAIRTCGRVMVVEGYMDVVALAQHEIEYAVATLGTATSATHVQKLLRQTDEVVFCFDGDAAGRKAAWHALEVSLSNLADHKAVRFLFLPPEHDPDSFVREYGKATFEKKLDEARPLSEYFLDELKGRVDMKTLEGRSRLVHEAKPLLQKISAPALQLQLLKTLADTAGMTQEEAAQLTEIRVVRSYAGKPAPARAPDKVMLGLDRKVEREILKCLLANPALANELRSEIVDAAHAEGRALLAVARYLVENSGSATPGEVMEVMRDSEHEPVLSRVGEDLLKADIEPADAEIIFRHSLLKIEIVRVEAELRELTRKAATGEATAADANAIKDLADKRKMLLKAGPNVQDML